MVKIAANVRGMTKTLVGIAAIAASLTAVLAPAVANAAPIKVSATDKIVIIHRSGSDPSTCTVGFVFTGTDGEPRAITAGHCGEAGDVVQTADHRTIGRIAETSFVESGTDAMRFNSRDTALVSFTPGAVTVEDEIPGVGRVNAIAEREDAERANPVACKLGQATGLTCGPLISIKTPSPMLAFRMASANGDSGAPVWMYDADGKVLALGTVSSDGNLPGGPGNDAGVTYVEPVDTYMSKWQLR